MTHRLPSTRQFLNLNSQRQSQPVHKMETIRLTSSQNRSFHHLHNPLFSNPLYYSEYKERSDPSINRSPQSKLSAVNPNTYQPSQSKTGRGVESQQKQREGVGQIGGKDLKEESESNKDGGLSDFSKDVPGSKKDCESKERKCKRMETSTYESSKELQDRFSQIGQKSLNRTEPSSMTKSYKDYVSSLLLENRSLKQSNSSLQQQNKLLKRELVSASNALDSDSPLKLRLNYILSLENKVSLLEQAREEQQAAYRKLESEHEDLIKINSAIEKLIIDNKQADLIIAKKRISELESLISEDEDKGLLLKFADNEKKLSQAEEYVKQITNKLKQLITTVGVVEKENEREKTRIKNENQRLKVIINHYQRSAQSPTPLIQNFALNPEDDVERSKSYGAKD